MSRSETSSDPFVFCVFTVTKVQKEPESQALKDTRGKYHVPLVTTGPDQRTNS